MTVTDAVPGVVTAESPYVGLHFYTQDNAAMFFGRDREQTVLISNLRASKLTLLYAQSGAGKSSLLRAGVASRLTDMARRGFAQHGVARSIPVVFSSWRDDPTAELIAAIGTAIAPFVGTDHPPQPTPERLDHAIETATRLTGASLLLILDQFEEYLLYRARESRDPPFADQLATAINRSDLRVNFLISIREDAYFGIGDLFKGKVSNVYGNYFHLEHLTREAARDAIEKPIASFNALHRDQLPMEIEPGVVEAVLGQLRPGQFEANGGGVGRLSEGNGSTRGSDQVAAPYLQLVMKRLWDAERATGSTTLRVTTLDELGGAQTIVRTHVDRALGNLSDAERETAAEILHHLVTPSGTKIALAAADLAEYTGRSADETNALLEELAGGDTRILAPVGPPPGRVGGNRFEISHDLLAGAILDWGRRLRTVRLEHEKQAAQAQAHKEKRRARIFRALAIASAILLAVAVGLAVAAVNTEHKAQASRNEAQSSRTAATAEAAISHDPQAATALALRALRLSPTAEAQTALRDALAQLQPSATLAAPPPLRSAAYSRDGRQVMTATADGTIRIWDAATDKLLATLAGFGSINSAAFNANATQIVTAGNDGTARILNAVTGKQVRPLTPSDRAGSAVSSAVFSPDSRSVVAAYADGSALIFNVATGKRTVLSKKGRDPLLDAAFSPDGKLVVTASSDGNARIYDAHSGAQQGLLPGSVELLSVAFSPDSKLIVTAGVHGARIWSAVTHRQVGALASATDNPYRVFAAAFSPDGKQIVTASDDGVARVWDTTSHRLVHRTNPPERDSLQTAAFSPDGNQVVTGSAGGRTSVWDPTSGAKPVLLSTTDGSDPLVSAALSPDGALAATGSEFGVVTIWKRQTVNSGSTGWTPIDVISMPEDDAVNDLSFSDDGTHLATANQSGRAYLWEVPTGLLERPIAAEGRSLNSVEFARSKPDLLMTASYSGNVRIFSWSTGNEVGKLIAAGSGMTAAALSADGSRVVTANGAGYAQVWNTANGKHVGGEFGYGQTINRVGFSADGGKVFTADRDGFTDIWDVTKSDTHQLFQVIREPGSNAANGAAFSPDGSAIVTAGTDGIAREWNVNTSKQTLALAGHSGVIDAVAFAQHEILTASSDGTARVWNSQPVEQRRTLPGPADKQVYTATFSPADPQIVATASADGKVRIWNTSEPTTSPRYTLDVPGAASAEFSKNGEFLVTAGAEHVQIWRMTNPARPEKVIDTSDTAGCRPTGNGETPVLTSATFSADGSHVVTTDRDGTACVWDWQGPDRAPAQVFTEPPGASGGIAGAESVGAAGMRWAVFSTDGTRVLTANNDGTARIWDVRSGRQVQALSDPTGVPLNDAFFSPDDRLVVMASNDGTALVWNAVTGARLQTLSQVQRESVYNAAFSPNGKLIVTCSDSVAVIWSVQSGQQLTDYPHGNGLSDCEWSPDGREVVTAGADGQTQIFSTELAGDLTQIRRIAEERVSGR